MPQKAGFAEEILPWSSSAARPHGARSRMSWESGRSGLPARSLLQEPVNLSNHRVWVTHMGAMAFRIHDHEFTVFQTLMHVLSDP